jgi:hypothetical protein
MCLTKDQREKYIEFVNIYCTFIVQVPCKEVPASRLLCQLNMDERTLFLTGVERKGNLCVCNPPPQIPSFFPNKHTIKVKKHICGTNTVSRQVSFGWMLPLSSEGEFWLCGLIMSANRTRIQGKL